MTKQFERTGAQKERFKIRLLIVKLAQKLHDMIKDFEKIGTSGTLTSTISLKELNSSMRRVQQYANRHPKLVHLNASYLKRVKSASPFLISEVLSASADIVQQRYVEWEKSELITPIKVQNILNHAELLLSTMTYLHELKQSSTQVK